MLQNYIKIALRSLWKNRTYSFVNIIGLAVGIAASVLILLFVSHEYSFDHFHKNLNSIYQVIGKINYGGTEINTTGLSSQFGPKLKEASAEAVDFVRTRMPEKVVIESNPDHRFFEQQFLFTDPSLFNVFSFEILKGNKNSLSRPNTVLITEVIARKYFGESDPIGKVITYDNQYLFEVVGIIKKAPSNSSIQFDFIASFSSLGNIASEKNQYEDKLVGLGGYITYIQINSENSIGPVEQTIAKITSNSVNEKFILGSFSNTHTNHFGTQNVNIFLSIALLILALALVNYINLTTARGLLRAKEVGIRKTIGARRSALTTQFYLESALMTFIAFGLAIVLIELFIPVFLNTIQQEIDADFLTSTRFVTLISSLFIVCIVLSGSYPALVLSQFKPTEVLKGKFSGYSQNSWLRKGFIAFQFTASMSLIICSLVVYKQLEFMQSTDVGLDKDQVLVVTITGDIKHNYTPLKEDIRKLAGIKSVGASSLALYNNNGINAFFTKTPTTHEDLFINMLSVDNQFLSTLNIEWIKKEKDSISTGDIIINEAALAKLKITANDPSKKLELWDDKSSPIEGIVKNFNYSTVKQPIGALVLLVKHDTTSNLVSNGGALYIKLNKKTSLHQSVAGIRKIYDRYESGSPFQYYFLDDAFNKLYRGEERLFAIFQAFTIIAIFIACLGLFGLITFNSERRAKEIGIRKILGASIHNILTLLSLEFIILITISIAIAAPLAWWAMHLWLQGFSYRIEIPLYFIIVAGMASLVIALVMISFQAIKAAVANPIDSLRNE